MLSAKIALPSILSVLVLVEFLPSLLCFLNSQEWSGVLQFDLSLVLPLGISANLMVLYVSEFQGE